MMRHVAIKIGCRLPRNHGSQMFRLQSSALPLILTKIRDAIETHLAIRPRLDTSPIDTNGQIHGLALRPYVYHALRTSRPPAVDPHHHIAIRNPFLRVDDFPNLILVGGIGRHLGVCLAHGLPLGPIQVFKMQPFSVGPHRQNDRVFTLCQGSENIAAQHNSIIHGDGHVPIHAHSVTHLADFAVIHG